MSQKKLDLAVLCIRIIITTYIIAMNVDSLKCFSFSLIKAKHPINVINPCEFKSKIQLLTTGIKFKLLNLFQDAVAIECF